MMNIDELGWTAAKLWTYSAKQTENLWKQNTSKHYERTFDISHKFLQESWAERWLLAYSAYFHGKL